MKTILKMRLKGIIVPYILCAIAICQCYIIKILCQIGAIENRTRRREL
ncbi:hypothetical protein FM106_14845 [Brachybacterium faecium]|nr:hypothetical protein FM106_14845 [Brachybacterium faecium]